MPLSVLLRDDWLTTEALPLHREEKVESDDVFVRTDVYGTVVVIDGLIEETKAKRRVCPVL